MRRKFYRSELTVSCESNARSKNLLGIAMSILVLMLISSMIVAAIVIINPDIVNLSASARLKGGPREAISVEESLMDEFRPANFAFQWLAKIDGLEGEVRDELLFEDSKNLQILSMPQMTASTGGHQQEPRAGTNYGSIRERPQVLVSNMSLLASVDYQGYRLSPSRRYLLLWTGKRRQFRHSFTAKFFVYDIKLDLILMLSTKQPQLEASAAYGNGSDAYRAPAYNSYENLDSASHYLNSQDASGGSGSGGNKLDNDDELARFQAADWFETGDKNSGDSLILIQRNDIYLAANISGQDNIEPVRVTRTGKLNEIYNGIADWLYEEEILADVPAYQVAPMGQALAYMSFNDSLVELMPFSNYGPSEQIVPNIQKIRYPKAGRVNPQVSVHIVDHWLGARRSLKLELPADLAQRQHYVTRIKWLTADKLGLIWLNRDQNEAQVIVCSRQSNWLCEQNLKLQSAGGWLDVSDDLVPLDDDHYLMLVPKFEGSDVGNFKHIAKVGINQANSFQFLTGGRREVSSIDGVNRLTNTVYYTATVEGEPGQRHLYSSPIATTEPTTSQSALGRAGSCITCGHYPAECLYNYAAMSPSAEYYLFECDGPGVPRTELRSIKPAARQTKMEAPIQSAGADPSVVTQQQATNNNSFSSDGSTLIWSIEDNQVLRDRLTYQKAMPLTLRLRVPIAGGNYSADVMMLLPPELSSTTNFRSPVMNGAGRRVVGSGSGSGSRARRSPLSSWSAAANGPTQRPFYAHYTADTIGEYVNQLASGQQWPMVVDVYGGPGSQKVNFRFDINFGHHLSSSRRAVYVMIDGRGSGNQGSRRLYELYHKLGTVEIQDQMDVASYLTQRLPFIDPNKVAIWGWSYGGYAAAMALAQSQAQAQAQSSLQQAQPAEAATAALALEAANKQTASAAFANGSAVKQEAEVGQTTTTLNPMTSTSSTGAAVSNFGKPHRTNGVFECAASVAPVTNWIYYDTAYTERYMSSPYLNERYDLARANDHNHQPGEAQLFASSIHPPQESSHTNKWSPLNQTSPVTVALRPPNVSLANLMLRSHYPSVMAQLKNTIPGRMSQLDLNNRYRVGSLLEHIGDIDRKRFLLIHGTADDNVHFQQSIMLMKRLISRNILFESRIYPDQDHGIANRADKLHLGATLSNFFAECFDMAY